jgi:hypothetical protein
MLPQCLITLNLLNCSRMNPQLFAQAHMHGAFDFNRTPSPRKEPEFLSTRSPMCGKPGHLAP